MPSVPLFAQNMINECEAIKPEVKDDPKTQAGLSKSSNKIYLLRLHTVFISAGTYSKYCKFYYAWNWANSNLHLRSCW